MVTSWTRSRRKAGGRPEEGRRKTGGRKDQIVPQDVAKCFCADKPADIPKRLPSWFRGDIPQNSPGEQTGNRCRNFFVFYPALCRINIYALERVQRNGSWLDSLIDRGSPCRKSAE